MKRVLSLFLLVGLLLGFSTQAAPAAKRNKGGDINVTDIKIRFFDTPIVSYTNINNTTRSGNARGKWAVMEIYYTPMSSSPLANGGWFDDVTMEGTLVLNSETRGKSDSLYIVFSGKTRFFTIQADGKEHIAMLAVPPKLLDRYYIANKNFTETMFVAAQVEFYGSGRVLLGEGNWQGGFIKKETDIVKARALMQKFNQNYSDVVRLRGGLYSKEKTPWAGSNYDFYDLIYDDVASDGAAQNIKK